MSVATGDRYTRTVADTNSSPILGGLQGAQSVAAAGTPVQLVAVATPCKVLVITARTGNTKNIAYGMSNTVRATAGAEVGAILTPGVSASLPVADVHSVWIDATVSAEGVSFTYLN